MIFVDTGAWYATFVPTDADHAGANAWFDRNEEPLVTTDYVIDELLTLMKVRGEYQRALRVGADLLAGDLCEVAVGRPEERDLAIGGILRGTVDE